MNLIDLSTASRRHFFFFIDKCNETYRSGHDLTLYRELIAMHREHRSLEVLFEDDSFYRKLYRTLEEWDMNKRGARLTTFDNFERSVRFWKDNLIRLYKYKLHEDIYDDLTTIKNTFEKVFTNLKVMDSKRKIVGVSKTLHFLLPDLTMPIDSKYTMTAFYGYNKYSDSAKQEFKTFWEIFESIQEITNRLELSPDDADGVLWKTSVPKLIDNSIIGLLACKKEEVLALFNTQEPENYPN